MCTETKKYQNKTLIILTDEAKQITKLNAGLRFQNLILKTIKLQGAYQYKSLRVKIHKQLFLVV